MSSLKPNQRDARSRTGCVRVPRTSRDSARQKFQQKTSIGARRVQVHESRCSPSCRCMSSTLCASRLNDTRHPPPMSSVTFFSDGDGSSSDSSSGSSSGSSMGADHGRNPQRVFGCAHKPSCMHRAPRRVAAPGFGRSVTTVGGQRFWCGLSLHTGLSVPLQRCRKKQPGKNGATRSRQLETKAPGRTSVGPAKVQTIPGL